MGQAGSRVSSFLYARRVVPARTGLTCQQSPAPATRVSRRLAAQIESVTRQIERFTVFIEFTDILCATTPTLTCRLDTSFYTATPRLICQQPNPK